MENNNGGKKLIVVVVAIIVIALVLAVWFSWSGAPANPTDETTGADFRSAQQANAKGVLEVPDQFPGNVVYVSRVELPAGGLVVIRPVSSSSAPVLGATYFSPETRIGNVDLTSPLVDGQIYLAQTYTDDGDQKFDETKDRPVIQSDGTPLQVQFKATKDLPERKG